MLRLGRKRLLQHSVVHALCRERFGQPVGRLAQKEGDRRGAGGDDAARSTAVFRGPCRVRRNAAPADDASETKIIKPAWIVMFYAPRKQRTLPLGSRRLETFELLDGRQHALFAGELRFGREVLPVLQPARKNNWGHGLHGLAQAGQGEAMDALQDAALAPFDGVGRSVGGLGMLEDTTHGEALHLHDQQRLMQRRGVKV